MTSRAIKQAACWDEARIGVAAIRQEPTIDPTVLLYLLDSFNFKRTDSHDCISLRVSFEEKKEKAERKIQYLLGDKQ